MEKARSEVGKCVCICHVLFFLLVGISYSATQAEIEQAIDNGISWLVAQQQGDGSWDPSGEPVACTGFAVIKLADRAFELGYTPFDPDYPYKNAIENGLDFLFQNGFVVDIYDQPAGNPDTDNDGKGVRFGDEYRTIYSTGICMMAIAATRAPDRVVGSIGSEVDGWTYKQVLDDVVDFMAFAQTDTPNPGRGGWKYRGQETDADNSNTGYAVSGLGYAESSRYGFNCAVPQFVKDELNIYIDYIQCDPGDNGHTNNIDGSSGYIQPCDSNSNVLKTGNLIGEMTFAGRLYNDPDLQRALAYIGRTWNDPSRDPGWGNGGTPHYQAMLCITRGLVYAGIDTIVVDGSPRDWYADFADAIVSHQQPDGSWPVDVWAGQIFATEWALLTLEKSAPTPYRLELEKDDHVDKGDCRGPEDDIQYTICWENTSGQTLTDAYIVDTLPTGVDYDVENWFDPNTWEIISSDPNYDDQTHTYIWPLGTLDPNDSGCVQLTVTVNYNAAPGSDLHNVAELWADILVPDPNDPNILNPETRMVAEAIRDTKVCCWQEMPDELFVDQNAPDGGDGIGWETAYNDLQDALEYAKPGVCGQVQAIYVAQGTYSPGDNEDNSFILPDNISLYGGFPTHGCDFSLRDPKKYITTLTGKIDDTHRNTTVLVMGNNTCLDGFTVTGASQEGYGIYGCCGAFSVNNCKIDRNEGYGAFIENANATFKWCNFIGNKRDGIRHTGSGYTLTLENCWVRQSGRHAVFSTDSTPTIINSVLSESDLSLEGRAGLMMENPTYRPYLQNVTCAHNKTYGIWRFGGSLPEIYNSIVYHNGSEALVGFSADDAAMYSCIEDANSVNYNINVDPQFAYFDPNNVRLSPQSDCRHASAPSSYVDYSNQLDMDGNSRVSVVDTPPDMGAYETTCDTEVSNVLDWNADGLVNLYEFNFFAKAWLTYDPNCPHLPNPVDPNQLLHWNPVCDLDSDLDVDLGDLMILVEDAPWLWRACWLNLEDLQTQQMTSGSSENTLALSGVSSSVSMESSSVEIFAESSIIQQAESVQLDESAPPEKSIAEQIADLQDSIEFLESIWNEDSDIQQEIDAKEWKEFMNAVYETFIDLQTDVIRLE